MVPSDEVSKSVQTGSGGVSSHISLKLTRKGNTSSTKQRPGQKLSQMGKERGSKHTNEIAAQKKADRRSSNNVRERWVINNTVSSIMLCLYRRRVKGINKAYKELERLCYTTTHFQSNKAQTKVYIFKCNTQIKG